MLVVGLGVFVVGSALAAMSPNVGLLLGARVVQGIGGAIRASGQPGDGRGERLLIERRGAAIGAVEGITGLAVIAGPVVEGW